MNNIRKSRRVNLDQMLVELEEKFNLVKDAVSQERTFKVELSVKLEFDNALEPEIVSFHGFRESAKKWTINFSHEIPGRLRPIDELRSQLNLIKERVEKYIADNCLEAEWIEQMELLKEEIESGMSADDIQNDPDFLYGALLNVGPRAYLDAPMMAIAYFNEGVNALDGGDLRKLGLCIRKGLRWVGEESLMDAPKNRNRARNRNGGNAKKKRYEPVKVLVSEWLALRTPKDGWASISELISQVDEYLLQTHLNAIEDSKLATHNLHRTIRDWFKREPERFVVRIKSKSN